MSTLMVYPDAAALARAAAEHFITLAARAAAARGHFAVALAGGSTPRATYALLATDTAALARAAARVDWSRVHVFWGDERCVPPDHPESNYRMARQALLDHVPIPTSNVHRIRGELPPDQAAAAYRVELDTVLGPDRRFDLILLGMGTDGHTASLFPPLSPALAGPQSSAFAGPQSGDPHHHHPPPPLAGPQPPALAGPQSGDPSPAIPVVAVYVEHLHAWRITLTLPVINAAHHVLFLVSGAAKADALARVRAGEPLPAALVRPTHGQLTWFVDRQAAPET